ncbi:MAG: hypothetical protein U9R51_06615 [Actinomycetota bacterium]|nr:hypothetical protein [Actinomycetota bacterium]
MGLPDKLFTQIDHQIDDLVDTQSATTTIDNPTTARQGTKTRLRKGSEALIR